MTRSRRNDERGIAIPLVALCLAVLITMVAFAVDLGQLDSTRRTMQANASQSQTLRYVEVTCLAGGGVLLVSGALVAIFAGNRASTPPVHAMVVPSAGGISFGIAGAF